MMMLRGWIGGKLFVYLWLLRCVEFLTHAGAWTTSGSVVGNCFASNKRFAGPMPPGHVKAKVGLSKMLMLLPTDRNYHAGTPIKYNLHLDIKSPIPSGGT